MTELKEPNQYIEENTTYVLFRFMGNIDEQMKRLDQIKDLCEAEGLKKIPCVSRIEGHGIKLEYEHVLGMIEEGYPELINCLYTSVSTEKPNERMTQLCRKISMHP